MRLRCERSWLLSGPLTSVLSPCSRGEATESRAINDLHKVNETTAGDAFAAFTREPCNSIVARAASAHRTCRRWRAQRDFPGRI